MRHNRVVITGSIACLLLAATTRPVVAGNGWEVIATAPATCAGTGGDTAVAVSPDDLHVYGLSSGVLYGYERDGLTGTLALVQTVTHDVPAGPRLVRATDLTLSGDAADLYVTADNALNVFTRDALTGTVTFLERWDDEDDPVARRLQGARAVAVSADGAHVYVAADDDRGLTVFARAPGTGALTLVETLFLVASGPTDIVVSPDGAHVYVASGFFASGQIDVFARDAGTGMLTPTGMYATIGGAGLAMSGDGANLYVAANPGAGVDAVLVFARDPSTGALTTIDEEHANDPGVTGLDGVGALAVSGDGSQVYAVASDDGALVTFARSAVDGTLTFVEADADGAGGIDGLEAAADVVVSPDGGHVYTAGEGLTAFARDTGNGTVAFVETLEPEGTNTAIVLSPDGAHVYRVCQRAIRAFARDGATGLLSDVGNVSTGQFVDDASLGVMTPDGAHLYVASPDDDRLAVFARDALTGELTLLATYVDGVGGFDGIADARSLAIAPDGGQIYVLGSDAPFVQRVAVLTCDAATGLLTPLQVVAEGGGVDGLEGANELIVSPDGAHVYVSSWHLIFGTPTPTDDGIAVFARDGTTGALSFVTLVTLVGAGSSNVEGLDALAVSPDGRHVYAFAPSGSDRALLTYVRDAATGGLSRISVQPGLLPTIDLVTGPDGAYVYAVRSGFGFQWGDELTVARRDAATGALGYADTLPGIARVTPSPDGAHLYAPGPLGDVLVLAPRAVCDSMPRSACVAPTKSTIRVLEKVGTKDVVRWKWNGAGPISLGDPLVDTDLALCLYDTGGDSQPIWSGFVPAGGTCGPGPCWKTTSSGFKYKDKPATPDGLTKAKVVLGDGGAAKLSVAGKGATLPPLGLPYGAPLTVQLQASTGDCWEAGFTSPRRSDAGEFTATE